METKRNTEAFVLLEQLVEALETTYWSSWQTTAKFDNELTVARDFIDKMKEMQQHELV